MRLTDRLSQPQKIVIVVALGMAFGAAGTYLVGLGNTFAGGWYSTLTRLFPDALYGLGMDCGREAARMAAPAHLAGADRPVGAAFGSGTAAITGTSPARLTAFRSSA